MANLGTERLTIVNDQPEITKLWNDRYRLEFYLSNTGKKDDWFAENIGNILPEFGTEQADEFGTGHWEPRDGEVYNDMRCIKAGTEYVPKASTHYVKLVYETLGDTFVEEKESVSDFAANGLKRSSRTLIAKSGVSYTKTVGVTKEGGLYLASYKIEDTDAYRRVEEVWMEAGTLSRTEDLVGSQKSIVIESIGPNPSTPSGYSLASKQESEYEGLQTNRFTFLEPSILSLTQTFVGGSSKVEVQAFDMLTSEVSSALSEVTSSHVLISESESDYDGIPTRQFSYQIDESFVEDYELNGLKRLTLVELSSSNFTPSAFKLKSVSGPTNGLYLSSQMIDNGGSVRIKESTWVAPGLLVTKRESESDGIYKVTNTYLSEEVASVGPLVTRVEEDQGGLTTYTVIELQNSEGGSIYQEGEEGSVPTSEYETLYPFTYPGIVSISNKLLEGTGRDYRSRDFELSPPCQTKIVATVKVSFQRESDVLYTSTDGLWSPSNWAQGSSTGIAWKYRPFSITNGFRGYRTEPEGGEEIENNASYEDLISGHRLWLGTKYNIKISGGPENPEGNEYTLDYQVDLAFEDVDGIPYYKHTEVVAQIPTR